MIKSAFKVTILLVIFVFLLSINIKGRPVFGHIYEFISPATRHAQKSAEDLMEKSFSTTKKYSKKLFDNSVPRMKDSVKSKLSSTERAGEPAERITEKEKAELGDLIKNH
jgi:hypothetical protein